jgi:hydrogenase expression/formation protein HypD
LLREVFQITDRKWRGIGTIAESGCRLSREFQDFDAERRFAVGSIDVCESQACISGQILQGMKKPGDCPAFGKQCSPEHPLGATMVSSEGACAAYYHYARYRMTSEANGELVGRLGTSPLHQIARTSP